MRFRLRFLGKAIWILAGLCVLGGLVMLLWNAVMPVLFSSAQLIDFPHALGLLVLSRILFGGFRGHHAGRGHWGRHAHITPREREMFHRHFHGGARDPHEDLI